MNISHVVPEMVQQLQLIHNTYDVCCLLLHSITFPTLVLGWFIFISLNKNMNVHNVVENLCPGLDAHWGERVAQRPVGPAV